MTKDEIDRLATGLAELMLGPTKRGPSDKVTDAIGLLIDIIANVDARVAELEQRPVLKHAGVWSEKMTYTEGNLTTHAGGMWLAQRQTKAKPGANNSDWRLIVKSGTASNGHDADTRRIATGVRR